MTQIPPETAGPETVGLGGPKRPKTMREPSGEKDGEPSLQVGSEVSALDVAELPGRREDR